MLLNSVLNRNLFFTVCNFLFYTVSLFLQICKSLIRFFNLIVIGVYLRYFFVMVDIQLRDLLIGRINLPRQLRFLFIKLYYIIPNLLYL